MSGGERERAVRGGEASAPGSGVLLLAAVALLSAATLGYEVLLTRLLAIVQWHHFAFLVISTALLGFGASGAFLAVVGHRLRISVGPFLALAALVFGLTAPACFAIAQRLPFNVLELPWSFRQAGWLLVIEVLLAIPFFVAATGIGRTLIVSGERLSRVYAADLAGAGGGAAAAVGLLWWIPTDRTLDGLGVVAAVAAGLAAARAPPEDPMDAARARGRTRRHARRRDGLGGAPGLAVQAAPAGAAGERSGPRRDPIRTARRRERGREREGAAAVGAGTQSPRPRPGPRAGGPLHRRRRADRAPAKSARGAAARLPRRPHLRPSLLPPGASPSARARSGRRRSGAPGARRRGARGGCGRASAGPRRHRAGPVPHVRGRRVRAPRRRPPHRGPAGVRRGGGRGGVRPHPGRCARGKPVRAPRPEGGAAPYRGVDARHARPARPPGARRGHRLEPASAAGRSAGARDPPRGPRCGRNRTRRRASRVGSELEHVHPRREPRAALRGADRGGSLLRAREGVRPRPRPGDAGKRGQPLQRGGAALVPRGGGAPPRPRAGRLHPRLQVRHPPRHRRPALPVELLQVGARARGPGVEPRGAGSASSRSATSPCPPPSSRRRSRARPSSSFPSSSSAGRPAPLQKRAAGRPSPASSPSVSLSS